MEESAGTVLHMTVDIGDGRQDVLQVTLNDNPQQLAEKFAARHRLPREMTEKLKVLITHNQAALRKYQIHTLSAQPSRSLSPTHQPSTRSISGYAETLYQRRAQAKKQAQIISPIKPKVQKPQQNTGDVLIQKGREVEERLKESRSQYLAEELKDCTFRPQIDTRSSKLSSRVHTAGPRHEKLYQDAKVRTELQKETYEHTVRTEFPYHPQVYSKRESGETREQIFNRLAQAKRQTPCEPPPEEGESYHSENAFFHPLTGRGPSGPEYMRKQPVHEHLYQLRTHKDKVKEELRARLEDDRKMASVFTTKRSELIVKQVWRRQLEKIFRALDGDRDGVINYDSLTASEVDERTLALLGPIWEEMRDRGTEYQLETFIADAEIIISQLSIEEKDYVLKAGLSSSPEPPLQSRQPQLSPVSKVLAANRFDDGDIYTKQLQEQEHTAEKIAKLKASLQEQELAKCTFRPETTKYVRR